MNLGFLQEAESPKHLEILLEEQWVRLKDNWQKKCISLNSDKQHKGWYTRMRLKNSVRLKSQQHLGECVKLEFCGGSEEALGPQENSPDLSFELANDLFLMSEVNVIVSEVIKVCHTNCVGRKRKRGDICTVVFACSVAEAAALLVGWRPQTALSIFSALLNCWPVIALLPAINVLGCVPALPGSDLGCCISRSYTIARNEGRGSSFVQLVLNILSTQPHRLVRFLPLSVLCGVDKELLEVLRFVRRSLYRCTKPLEDGLRVSVLRTCDGCQCFSNPTNDRSNRNSASSVTDAQDNAGQQSVLPLYGCDDGAILIERYTVVKSLLLIVAGIGGNNLCHFVMRCSMRLVSRSLKFFNPGYSQQHQQSLSHVTYSFDILIGIIEHCPLKNDTLQDTIHFLMNLAVKEYESSISSSSSHGSPPSAAARDYYPHGLKNQEDIDSKNILYHRRQWLIIRRALSISLLKLNDKSFLLLKPQLSIVFDVGELSEEEEEALSIDELILERRLIDLQIIRSHRVLPNHEEIRQRASRSFNSDPVVNIDSSEQHSLAKSKPSTTVNNFEEEDGQPLAKCTVVPPPLGQESLLCILALKFPKCFAFIERATPLKRWPTRNALSSNIHENIENSHCIIGEESNSPSSLIFSRDGSSSSFPAFVLEFVLDFLAPKRICRASCVCVVWRYVCSSPPHRIWAKQFDRRWPLRSFTEINGWLSARVRPPVTFVETSTLDLHSGRMFPVGYVNVDWLLAFRQRWISEMKARCGRKGLIVCPWFNCSSLVHDGKMFKRHLCSAHNVQLDDITDQNVSSISSKRRTA